MARAESIRADYERVYSERRRAAAKLESLLQDLLIEQNCHDVSARAKEVASFCAKASKQKDDGSPKYADPLREIEDQVAARVITYIPETVDSVCTLLGSEFQVIGGIDDKGERMRREGKFGYASKHMRLRLNPERAGLPENAPLADLTFELQVRTVVQHAWAEFEHDVRYKYEIPIDKKPQFDRSFALAAALLEMADREFAEINTLFQELARDVPRPTEVVVSTAPEQAAQRQDRFDSSLPPLVAEPVPLTGEDLPALLAKRYPDATRSRRSHYSTMVSVLSNLDLHTVDDLDQALVEVDSEAVARAMDHKLPAGHVRRLEDDLLLAFGKRYFEASDIDGLSGRKGILVTRLKKLGELRR